MSIEEILFGNIVLGGEYIRFAVAVLGLLATSYFDLFNNRNVPDQLLYGFLGVAILLNLVFFNMDLFLLSLGVALFLSIMGYIFYRAGQLGLGDIFVIDAIVFLLPIQPSFVTSYFNIPFVLPVFLFSAILVSIYSLITFGMKILRSDARPNLLYILLLIPYAIFAYLGLVIISMSVFYFVLVTIVFMCLIFFLMYKQYLAKFLSEDLPLHQVQPEDVVAIEYMNQDLVSRFKIPRVLTKKDLERLKQTKVRELRIYTKLIPYLPFMLVGLILALFLTKYINPL